MISATDLRLTFGKGTPLENPALRGMSLTVNQGEFVTVIGSNGAGKSTFLNALSGEVMVDSGQIIVDNQDVTRLPTHKRASRVADRKSTRLNSSHVRISYAVFCLKKKTKNRQP